MDERKVSVKNIITNYKVEGEGKPIILLHGWPSNSDRWEDVAQILANKGWQVFVPDLPGFGKTQQPPTAWNLDAYVDWLHQFAEKIPQLQRSFYLIGHSFGGSLAAKFTIKYNQRVEKLFLLSASCIRENTQSKKMVNRFAKLVKIFSFIPGYEFFRRAVYKFIIRKSDYAYVSGVMKETYLKVIADDLSFRLSFIKNPTVIIWGDKDESTPLEDAHFINQKIRNSKLIVIEGVRHDLNRFEQPEVLATKILENI